MENELKILQDLVYSEYANNEDVSFNGVKIKKIDGRLRFSYFIPIKDPHSGIELETKEVFCNVDHVLELIIDKMYNSFDETPCSPGAKLIVNRIYNSIYNLYKKYIAEENYYI
jgi:hypothetical protein